MGDAGRAITAFAGLATLLLSTAMERFEASGKARRAEDVRRRGEELGRLRAIAETFEDARRIVERARLARHSARDRLRDDPGRLREDDGFKRSP